MQINFAHLRERAQSGGYIDFAVFDAKSNTGCSDDNNTLLGQLTREARQQGLKIDQSALAYRSGSQTKFYGDESLISYLSRRGVPRWTHTLRV